MLPGINGWNGVTGKKGGVIDIVLIPYSEERGIKFGSFNLQNFPADAVGGGK